MTDTATLLRQYNADRAEDAFAELVRRHVDFVYRTALGRLQGHTHQAEDVTQQVFVDLARKAGRLSRHPNLAGWLYLATRHAAAALMRREQRRQAREQEAWAMNEPSRGLNDRTQLRPLLDTALERLRARDREVILLRFYEQRPFGEVGALLKLTEDAARRRTDRALDRLRTILRRQGLASSALAIAAAFGGETAVAAPAGLAAAVLQGAGAALSGGVATGIVAIMTTNKVIGGIAALLALALGGTVYESVQLRSDQTELAVAARAQDTLVAQHRAAMRRRQAAGAGGGGAPGPSPVATGDGRLTDGASRRWSEFGKKLASDPALQEAYVNNLLLQQDLVYAASLRAAGLSAEQTERFQDLLRENLRRMMEIRLAALSIGLQPEDPAVRALIKEDGAKFESAAAPIFPSGQFEHFENGIEYFFELGPMAGSLYDTGNPLTLAQGDELRQLMAQLNPADENDWSRVVQAAPSILSPAQVPAFQALTEQLKFQIAVNRAYAAAASGRAR